MCKRLRSSIKSFTLLLNVQSDNKKKNTSTNSNTNYRLEMKLVPINMDYCPLQFDALNFELF